MLTPMYKSFCGWCGCVCTCEVRFVLRKRSFPKRRPFLLILSFLFFLSPFASTKMLILPFSATIKLDDTFFVFAIAQFSIILFQENNALL